ncbi:MAG: Gfo/Idh/MocA family oxidoreductase [Planctomycetaceae bacterium]|nr:Gfo/Idh/MocA family oxidoreductase [Planctomycetaceae bacterium]
MMKRRTFLKNASLAASMLTAVPFSLQAGKAVAKQSPSDRIRFALIGAGSQGTHDASLAIKFGELVAICDADLRQAENAKARLKAENAEIFQRYEKILDRKDIDAVIVAVPDHWHTKVNIECARAGKDIYGEKPLTYTIDEGKLLCKVIQETGRVFQTGTQQRSGQEFQTAVELVRNGRIGKLQTVWVAVPFFSTKGGPFKPQEVPPEVDWDYYQGPAPFYPYTVNRSHRVWRWWYEYAGGIVTDWGNHHVDIAHWGMDCERTGPVSVEARGLFPNEDDPEKEECYNTSDRFFSRMMYPNGVELLYFSGMKDFALFGDVETHVETGQSMTDWLFGEGVPDEIKTYDRNGIMFLGDKGRIFVNRGGLFGQAVDELKDNPLPENAWKARPSLDHIRNFFDCIRSREEPVAPVEIEHRSITACHLTNISIRLGGRPLKWDPEKEEIVGDGEAQAMQSRTPRKPYEFS